MTTLEVWTSYEFLCVFPNKMNYWMFLDSCALFEVVNCCQDVPNCSELFRNGLKMTKLKNVMLKHNEYSVFPLFPKTVQNGPSISPIKIELKPCSAAKISGLELFIFTYMCMYMYVHIYACVYVYAHISACVHTYYLHTCLSACIYM